MAIRVTGAFMGLVPFTELKPTRFQVRRLKRHGLMPERIAHVEKHEGGRGFGSHQFWHGLRMALDLDGIITRVLPPGSPVIVSILVVGWYVSGLGLPAPTRPAGLRPPLRITGGAATLLQTAQGGLGHIVVHTNTQVDARSNRQAGDGEGRAGDHCV